MLDHEQKIIKSDHPDVKVCAEALDFDLLKKFHHYLKLIYEAHEKLYNDDTLNSNLVLIKYTQVLDFCQEIDNEDQRFKELKRELKEALLNDFQVSHLFYFATFLTPQFRKLPNLVDETKYDEIKGQIENLILNSSPEASVDETNIDDKFSKFSEQISYSSNEESRK